LANQFRVYAHWSSSDGVDAHTAQRKFVFTLVLTWYCTLIDTIQPLCLVWISVWDVISIIMWKIISLLKLFMSMH